MKEKYLPWGQLFGESKSPTHFSRNPEINQQIAQIGVGSLPYGCGRSYGDSCLSSKALPLVMDAYKQFISFNVENGILQCEAGTLLSEILDIIIPKGWFLPVTPGTQYVTIAGAVANDVHGKNHQKAGSLGCHIIDLGLLRSSGEYFRCSPSEHEALFSATVGGLGLTGLITDVTLQLKKVASTNIDSESIKFFSLSEYFDIAKQSEDNYEYTVSWIDCLAKGASLGRGIFHRGNHQKSDFPELKKKSERKLTVPFALPFSLINNISVTAFNKLFYSKQTQTSIHNNIGYEPFFYPLDSISSWNRLYGRKGFQQLQFAVPKLDALSVVTQALQAISANGTGSFLVVLKEFGAINSPGILSFPMEGTTLAIDFPNGRITDKVIQYTHDLVAEAGGRIYPAKDAAMSSVNFKKYYQHWELLEQHRDPKLCSKFWDRTALA